TEWYQRRPVAAWAQVYQARTYWGASRGNDYRGFRFNPLSDFVLVLPRTRRLGALQRARTISANLFQHSHFAHFARSSHRAVGDHYVEPRAARALRSPSGDCALDLSAVVVCVHNRWGHLFHALSSVHILTIMAVVRLKIDVSGTVGDEAWRNLPSTSPERTQTSSSGSLSGAVSSESRQAPQAAKTRTPE